MRAEKTEKASGPGYLERVHKFVSSQVKEENLRLRNFREGLPPEKRKELDSLLLRAVYEGKEEEVERLLKAGADPDASTLSGFTALMDAAQCNRIGIGRLLIKYEANVKATDEFEWTAFMVALRMNHMEFAKLLVENGADPNQFPKKEVLH